MGVEGAVERKIVSVLFVDLVGFTFLSAKAGQRLRGFLAWILAVFAAPEAPVEAAKIERALGISSQSGRAM